jgi:ABC-2 type transport system ATP-binding protein
MVLQVPELEIMKGEIFGLVGNNGAGKTTLFRLMLDLIKADSGQIKINDNVVAGSEAWKDYTSSFLDDSFLLDFLTPDEYFDFIGKLYQLSQLDISSKLEPLKPFFHDEILGQSSKCIRDFSKGNKQKIGIAGAMLSSPQVLILDEPFNSLDPSSQMMLKRILVDYNHDTGATILVSSHDLNHITDICQRIVLMEKGKIIQDLQNDGEALLKLENYFSVGK